MVVLQESGVRFSVSRVGLLESTTGEKKIKNREERRRVLSAAASLNGSAESCWIRRLLKKTKKKKISMLLSRIFSGSLKVSEPHRNLDVNEMLIILSCRPDPSVQNWTTAEYLKPFFAIKSHTKWLECWEVLPCRDRTWKPRHEQPTPAPLLIIYWLRNQCNRKQTKTNKN